MTKPAAPATMTSKHSLRCVFHKYLTVPIRLSTMITDRKTQQLVCNVCCNFERKSICAAEGIFRKSVSYVRSETCKSHRQDNCRSMCLKSTSEFCFSPGGRTIIFVRNRIARNSLEGMVREPLQILSLHMLAHRNHLRPSAVTHASAFRAQIDADVDSKHATV